VSNYPVFPPKTAEFLSEVQFDVDTVRKAVTGLKRSAYIAAVELFANTWYLDFNVAKSVLLHFGHNNPAAEYVLGGSTVPAGAFAQDLGVAFSANMKARKHCQRIASASYFETCPCSMLSPGPFVSGPMSPFVPSI
jgi:hypothetical protein